MARGDGLLFPRGVWWAAFCIQFWTAADLEDKLQTYQHYFNKHRTHSGLEGRLPEPGEQKVTLDFASYRWKQHCRGLYQTPTAA